MRKLLNTSFWILFAVFILNLFFKTTVISYAAYPEFVSNRAKVLYEDVNGNDFLTFTQKVETPLKGVPVLQISKTENSNPIATGTIIIYTINYENTGNAIATGVLIIDYLSGNLIFLEANGIDDITGAALANPTYNNSETGIKTIDWNIGAILPNGKGTLTIKARVKDNLEVGTYIKNRVTIQAPNIAGDEDITTTLVDKFPNLQIAMLSYPQKTIPGGAITYTIKYKNIGNIGAGNVLITSSIPDLTAYKSGSAAYGSVSNRRFEYYLDVLPAGASGDLSFQVTVSPIANSGEIIKNKSVIYASNAKTAYSKEITNYVLNPSLTITKIAASESVRAGNDINYTIKVINNTNFPLNDVIIKDAMPIGTSFVSADENGILDDNTVIWKIGNMAKGDEKDVYLVLKVSAQLMDGDKIINKVVVNAEDILEQSASAETKIYGRTKGELTFFDNSWNKTSIYSTGNDVCVQLTDYDQNVSPLSIEQTIISISKFKKSTGGFLSEFEDTVKTILTETNINTGVFRGCIKTNNGPIDKTDNELSVEIDGKIRASYVDSLDSDEFRNIYADALIDPFGIVFDSQTGLPVQGAQALLYKCREQNFSICETCINSGNNNCGNLADPASLPTNIAGCPDIYQKNPSSPTLSDGFFAFRCVREGLYYLSVNPATDYNYPSKVAPDNLPAGFTINNSSYGKPFLLSQGMEPLNIDIPLDHSHAELINVVKTANKKSALIGDIVNYKITVLNAGNLPLSDIKIIDTLPHGFAYVKGSTKFSDGNGNIEESIKTMERTIIWHFINKNLPVGQFIEINYKIIAGADSEKGDGINSVYAEAKKTNKTIISEIAKFKINISEGVFTSKGTIIGKVFMDFDKDGIQEQGEYGLENAALYLEDGSYVLTDRHGKFSFYNINRGNHVLRLDETTLPNGVKIIPSYKNSVKNSLSKFVNVTTGNILKVNFGVERMPENSENSYLFDRRNFPLPLLMRGLETQPILYFAKNGILGQPVEETAKEKSILQENSKETLKKLTESDSKENRNEEKISMEELIVGMSPELEILEPSDNATSAMRHIEVLVKAPLDKELTLKLNGKEIEKNKIGRTIVNGKDAIVLYEFIGIELNYGKKNYLKAEIKNKDGTVISTREKTVISIANFSKITAEPEKTSIPANGVSLLNIKLSLFDINGNKVVYPVKLTISTTRGEIANNDLEPLLPDIQIIYGKETDILQIRSSAEPGKSLITISAENVKETIEVFFTPDLRSMLIAGIGEIVVGHTNTHGEFLKFNNDKISDDNFYSGVKGAVFMKGKVKRDILLTASYDSEKEKKGIFFNEDRNRINSEEKYQIYGDESKINYEALSQDKLYLRVDKGNSYCMYGDYQTNFNDTELGVYIRTFNGFTSEIIKKNFKLHLFNSYTHQTQAVDKLPAKGISGNYYLSHQQIVEGSEMVVVETRSRYQPERVIKKENKARHSDYFINYEMGTVLFKSAISSYDVNLNPVYIIVSYESIENDKKYSIYGSRFSINTKSGIHLGVTNIKEEKAVDDYNLTAADLSFNLFHKMSVTTEWAETQSLLSIDSVYTQKKADAWLLKIENNYKDNLYLNAYYKRIGNYFNNPSALNLPRGSEKHGLTVKYSFAGNIAFHSEYFDERDGLNNSEHKYASIGLEKPFKKVSLETQLYRETSNANYIKPTSSTTRYPFEISEDTPKETTSLQFKIDSKVTSRLSLTLDHKQDIQYNKHNITQAGADYQLNKNGKAYLKQEYGRYENRKDMKTIIGLGAQIGKNTTAFNEYSIESGINGERAQHSIGLTNNFILRRNVTGNFTVENLNTISGTEKQNRGDSFAISTALEYLPYKDMKLTSRIEYRQSALDLSHLEEVGITATLNPDYVLLFKQHYFTNKFSGRGKHTLSDVMLGLAYRPVKDDLFNALVKLEFKYDKNTTAAQQYLKNAFIMANEFIYHPYKRLQLTGKYAFKISREDDIRPFTDLISSRLEYEFARRFDIVMEYRVLKNHNLDILRRGGIIEIGYKTIKNVWISTGYSFDTFDVDLTENIYWGRGPYITLRFKFDETLFKKNSGVHN